MEPHQSASKMVSIFRADPSLLQELTSGDPLPILEKVAATAERATDPAYLRDKILYRFAVGILGTLAIVAALGALYFATKDKAAPESVIALGAMAAGALVGLFAPSPSGK